VKVRPITVMAGLAAVVAVAAVTSAWLPGNDATTVGLPSSLPIILGSGAQAAMAPASTIAGSTTYVRGPGLSDLTDTQAAWSFSTTPAAPAAIRALGTALGVTGGLQTVAGGWRIGADGGPALQVSSTPGSNWTFESGQSSGGVACASASSSPAAGDGSGPSTTIPGTPDTSTTFAPTATPDCTIPPPPAGVPDRATAEAAARRVLQAAGLDSGHLELSTQADGYSATVTAAPVLDGTPTVGIDTTISFGGAAAITYASGWLGRPARADTYPLLGTDAAIDRLNRGVDLMGPQPLGMIESAGTTSGSSAPGGPIGSGGSTVTTPTISPTTVPDSGDAPPPALCPQETATTSSVGARCGPSPDPYPGPTVVPDPVPKVQLTVTITSSTVVLIATPGQDGTTWLVPAYELRSTDSGGGEVSARWFVLGVDESFVAPPTTPMNPGSDPGCYRATPDPTPLYACPAEPSTTGTTLAR
jgi:hypothetical protein